MKALRMENLRKRLYNGTYHHSSDHNAQWAGAVNSLGDVLDHMPDMPHLYTRETESDGAFREDDITHSEETESDISDRKESENDIPYREDEEDDVTYRKDAENGIAYRKDKENGVAYTKNEENHITYREDYKTDYPHLFRTTPKEDKINRGDGMFVKEEGADEESTKEKSAKKESTKEKSTKKESTKVKSTKKESRRTHKDRIMLGGGQTEIENRLNALTDEDTTEQNAKSNPKNVENAQLLTNKNKNTQVGIQNNLLESNDVNNMKKYSEKSKKGNNIHKHSNSQSEVDKQYKSNVNKIDQKNKSYVRDSKNRIIEMETIDMGTFDLEKEIKRIEQGTARKKSKQWKLQQLKQGNDQSVSVQKNKASKSGRR